MPWIDIEDEHGNKTGTVHVNFGAKGNREFQYCKFCLSEGRRRPSSKLCDFDISGPQVVTHRRTCDAPMCEKHSQVVGKDRDYCPEHRVDDLFSQNEEAATDMADWKYKTEGELNDAGYSFRNMATCSGDTCQRQIEWWTTPAGKHIPLDEGTLQPHWTTCPDVEKFRGARAKYKEQLGTGEEFMHTCPAIGCGTQVKRDRLMCMKHWNLVPAPLQASVWRLYKSCAKGANIRAYQAARKAAIDIVAHKEGKVA